MYTLELSRRNAYIWSNVYAGICYLISLTFNSKLIPLVFKGHIFLVLLAFMYSIGLRLLYRCSKFFRDYVDYIESSKGGKRIRESVPQVEKIVKIERKVREPETSINKESEPQLEHEELFNKEEHNSKDTSSLEKTFLYNKSSSASEDPLMKELLKINEMDR